jgi:hypothetical protein
MVADLLMVAIGNGTRMTRMTADFHGSGKDLICLMSYPR